ncbi:hypothetical protein SAMN02745136_03182 [Anaerocolumna jejuensis DSM 15929]|uniref:Lipoprotein n=1 Tax=Anaerocolumna jejuensis DSM 15929 TaxID=1121322 RepID=A0A1M6UTR4_9FIRM|nr:hypothetical protein [Anaerocolumna jejuensis]SHK72610.1 hypothetical protein SAMN02745136_03182 [Anaerocolumna jejuensis DSM 15929]
MLKKFILLSFILICCITAISCGKKVTSDTISNIKNQDANSSTPPADKEDDNITPTNIPEPFVGSKDLDSKTEKFFYGPWKVEKLLGFANSYNDASEYPTGQKIIGDEIKINEDFFSSKGLENYTNYQYELENPIYDIEFISYDEDSFYREFKTEFPDLNPNDEVKYIGVADSSTELSIPLSFLIVNNSRLILVIEATFFELERVSD